MGTYSIKYRVKWFHDLRSWWLIRNRWGSAGRSHFPYLRSNRPSYYPPSNLSDKFLLITRSRVARTSRGGTCIFATWNYWKVSILKRPFSSNTGRKSLLRNKRFFWFISLGIRNIQRCPQTLSSRQKVYSHQFRLSCQKERY